MIKGGGKWWAKAYRFANFSLGGPSLGNRPGRASGQSEIASGPPISNEATQVALHLSAFDP